MRRNNQDSLKGIECKKIRVAGDDVSGVTTYCKLEKFVVLRVTACCDSHIDNDPFSLPCQGSDKR
jgi:hypothetical protein